MLSDTLSTSVGKKIQEMRKAEGYTQATFGELVGLSLDTIKGFESGRSKQVSVETLLKITNHPEFEKYTLWLMTGHVSPEGGQISPEIKLQAAQLKTGS